MVECKAWGSPEQYPSYTGYEKWYENNFKEMINKWESFIISPTNKWNIKKLDEIWFVVPGYCDDNIEIQQRLSKKIGKIIKIIPIHELLLDIMFEVKKDKNIRRKRYSNPALEFCRWLLRSHETGHLSLIDVDLKLKGEKQTYDILRKNYFRDCLKVTEKNAEKRNAGIDTRINTLKILVRLSNEATVREIETEAAKLGYKLNYNRIKVGLGTWCDLGIVLCENNRYFINYYFRDIIKLSLR